MANWFKSILGWFKQPVASGSTPQTDAPQPSPSAPPAQANLFDKKSKRPLTSEPSTTPKTEPERAEPSTVTRYQESCAPTALPAPPLSSPQSVADLTIGFDLGTSCSKVAVGDSVLGSQYGVPFNTRAHGVAKYLFPTRFYEGADGISLSSGQQAKFVSNLKLRLTEAVENHGDTSGPETDLAILRRALVLKHTLAWYEQHRAGDHRARARCWWLSFGFPAKRVDNSPRLHKTYQRFAGAAIHGVGGRGRGRKWFVSDRAIRLNDEIASTAGSKMLSRDRQIRMQLHQLMDAFLFALSFWLAFELRSNRALGRLFHLGFLSSPSTTTCGST